MSPGEGSRDGIEMNKRQKAQGIQQWEEGLVERAETGCRCFASRLNGKTLSKELCEVIYKYLIY